MINELHNLAKTLESLEIPLCEWDREYKGIPKVTAKSPCIRISLDRDGSICGLESLSPELASVLRKYGNNHGSFPAFNILPLYRLTDSESIDELEKIGKGQCSPDIEKIKSWRRENNWIKGAPKQVQRSLKERPQKLLEAIGTQAETEDNIIIELISLCEKLCTNINGGFRASLENCIFEEIQKGDAALGLSLLFHKGSVEKEHSEDMGDKISVILDVKDWRRYGYPVASEHTTIQLNRMLLANSGQAEIPTDCSRRDAFGSPFVNPQKPMPSVKLSGFAVILRSMFHGHPCQYRYKQIDDGSYPISIGNRSSIKKSLEWIADPSRRQVTWEKVDKDEVVFVYPSMLPKVSPKFASVFGSNPAEQSKKTETRFIDIAKEFSETFRGLPVDQKPDDLQIFTVRKLDKARSKILFTHNTTPEQLVKAAEAWSAGCRNIPSLITDELVVPFPLEVAAIVNGVWKQNGERAGGKASVQCMKYYQGMQLLLDILPQDAVYNFLHNTLKDTSGLINYLGNLLHRGRKGLDNTGLKRLKAQKNAASQIISVLGLLLYKCNIRKEKYMEELAYLLGELLHVSDELHTLYCRIKRNGDIPPQLAGSALFVTAGEMPYQALSQLSTRLNPYLSWAKQYQHKEIDTQGEESWRARWLLWLFERLSNKVHLHMDKSIRFGDYEKAQLFIGYMASLPKKEETDQYKITGGNENG